MNRPNKKPARRLLKSINARGNIPRIQAFFPKTVKPSASDIRHINFGFSILSFGFLLTRLSLPRNLSEAKPSPGAK